MLNQYLACHSVTNSAGVFSDMSRCRFGVFNFKLRYYFRLQPLGYILYITVELITIFTEDYCIWDSELLQRTATSSAQENLLCIVQEFVTCAIWQYPAVFFFLLFSLSVFFFFFFFFCMLFVNVLKISILPSLCPNNFFFFFFSFSFFTKFSYGNFSAFQTYVSSQHFFIFFELSSYFIYLGSFNTIFILFCNQ